MYKHKVQYYETDMMGITHHSNYIRWMEEARTDYLEKLGWPYKRMEEEGLISPTISVECKYVKTTTFEDVICIDAQIEEYKGVKIKFKYTMTKEDGTVVCEAHSQHCFVNTSGTPIALKKVRPELHEVILNNIAP